MWSGIFCGSSAAKFHDPASRLRVLAQHRSGPHKSRKPAAGQVSLSFVRQEGIGHTYFPAGKLRDPASARRPAAFDSCSRRNNAPQGSVLLRVRQEGIGLAYLSSGHKFACAVAQATRDPGSRSRKLAGHRSGPHKSRKPAAGQVFLSFVRAEGIEPSAFPLSEECSTTELRAHILMYGR